MGGFASEQLEMARADMPNRRADMAKRTRRHDKINPRHVKAYTRIWSKLAFPGMPKCMSSEDVSKLTSCRGKTDPLIMQKVRRPPTWQKPQASMSKLTRRHANNCPLRCQESLVLRNDKTNRQTTKMSLDVSHEPADTQMISRGMLF